MVAVASKVANRKREVPALPILLRRTPRLPRHRLRIQHRLRRLLYRLQRLNSDNKWSFLVEIFEIDPVPAFRSFARHIVAVLHAVARAGSADAFGSAGFCSHDASSRTNSRASNAGRERANADAQRQRVRSSIRSAAYIL